jgi:hypothetical protein
MHIIAPHDNVELSAKLVADSRLKGHIRSEWSDLSEVEIDHVEKNRDRFYQSVGSKYGLKPSEIERRLREWLRQDQMEQQSAQSA